MIGVIKIKASKNLVEPNTYIFKFSKEALEILNTGKVEVKLINDKIILFKPSLSTRLEYKITINNTIKVSTQSAFIDISGEYYIDFEEDDRIGYNLNKTN